MSVAMRYGSNGKTVTKSDPLLVERTYSYNYTISGNGSLLITAANFGVVDIAGYTPLALRQISPNSSSIVIRYINAQLDGNVVALRNVASSSVSQTCYIIMVYAKSTEIG